MGVFVFINTLNQIKVKKNIVTPILLSLLCLVSSGCMKPVKVKLKNNTVTSAFSDGENYSVGDSVVIIANGANDFFRINNSIVYTRDTSFTNEGTIITWRKGCIVSIDNEP